MATELPSTKVSPKIFLSAKCEPTDNGLMIVLGEEVLIDFLAEGDLVSPLKKSSNSTSG